MSAQPKSRLTQEQYLEIERKAETKSEFYNGEMFAMAGAGYPHNRLVWRLIGLLDRQLPASCVGLPSDMRVRISGSNATGLYTYPDIVVVCGKAQFTDGVPDTLVNPSLIVEVLSPSTESYDRGRKFEHYTAIPSFNTYVLVASDRIHVDVYVRQPDNRWLRSSASNLTETLTLESIHCQVTLAELYSGIELD